LAERVGFEPTVEFPQHTLSKRTSQHQRLRALYRDPSGERSSFFLN
jgi:hypothetical protein